MVDFSEGFEGKNCWFVGAAYGSTEDVSSDFIKEGIWINGYDDKYHDQVKSIKPGDWIAIKSAYTRKNGVKFDNRGQHVSVMAIKAVGKVLENNGDGKHLKVDWTPVEPAKEWYFYTNRLTVWRVAPESWMSEGLIRFTFLDERQDIDRFRNAPFWSERFGDNNKDTNRFPWTRFYQNMADRLLAYRHDRTELVSLIHNLGDRIENFPKFIDKLSSGEERPLRDICPFTIFGIFTRGMTDENRTRFAYELAQELGVEEKAPVNFDGIPVLNNQNTWFFGFSKLPQRQEDDIDVLWSIFESAITFSSDDTNQAQNRFLEDYNEVASRYNVGWNLTMGLYWIRPWFFPPLDAQSQRYITKKLGIKVGLNGPNDRCNANDYLTIKQNLESRFLEDTYPVHSFPDFSLQARRYNPPADNEVVIEKNWRNLVYAKIVELCNDKGSAEFTRQEFKERYLDDFKQAFPDNNSCEYSIDSSNQKLRDEGKLLFLGQGRYELVAFDEIHDADADYISTGDESEVTHVSQPYSIGDIIDDGCFLDVTRLREFLARLRTKKNIIFQGPPGTGKSWLAKRLGYALMGERDDVRLRAVQFHPNLSYEDFVRGYRPSADGQLSLKDGPMMEMVNAAIDDPEHDYVLVIEEINRGNPAQIFGEMLTLLEADKRNPDEALELSYRRTYDERVSVPENLYVIGTMNIADRSLAMVDLALRRRFAFINLEPELNNTWLEWVAKNSKADTDFLRIVRQRLNELNEEISNDPVLGEQFQIGHSYVTPSKGYVIEDPKTWFKQVVRTEIGVLLEEYWYEDLQRARGLRDRLIEGI